MSDKDSKENQDKTDEQYRDTKASKGSDDGNIKGQEETKASESKQSTTQDTQTDNTDRKESKRKDSQTDAETETPVDSKGTDEGQEGSRTMESMPNGSDTSSVSEKGDNRDVSNVEQAIGYNGEQNLERLEGENLVENSDKNSNEQERIEESTAKTEISDQSSDLPNPQHTGGEENSAQEEDDKFEESGGQADDTGQVGVPSEDVKKGGNQKNNALDDDDDDDEDDGDDESGSGESDDDSEDEQTTAGQVTISEAGQSDNVDRKMDQTEGMTSNQAESDKKEGNTKLAEESVSQELKQSDEGVIGEGERASQGSDKQDRGSNMDEQKEINQRRDSDQPDGKVYTQESSSDRQERDIISSDNDAASMNQNNAQNETDDQNKEAANGELRPSPVNSTDDKRHVHIEDRDSPTDSIVDKIRETELESSFTNQSEQDEASVVGHPPISTVYVKPQRQQSDSESQASYTAPSQDEIEIVSKANRDTEVEENEEKEVGEIQTNVENKQEEVDVTDHQVEGHEEEEEGKQESVNEENNTEMEQVVEVKAEGEVEENNTEMEQVVEVKAEGEVEGDAQVDIQNNGEEANKVKVEGGIQEETDKETTEVDDTEKGEVKVEIQEERQDEGEKKDKEERESEDDSDDSSSGSDESEEKDANKKEPEPESVSGDKNGAVDNTEAAHVDVQQRTEKEEDRTVAQSEVNSVKEEETDRRTPPVSERPPPVGSEAEQQDELEKETHTKDEVHERKPSVGQEEDKKSLSNHSFQSRGSVRSSRESLRSSKASLQKQEHYEVREEPADAAQVPVTPPQNESETGKETDDDRGKVQQEEVQETQRKSSSSKASLQEAEYEDDFTKDSVSSRRSSSDRKSSSSSLDHKSDSRSRVASQTSVKKDAVETGRAKSPSESEKKDRESAQEEEPKSAPEPKQSKPGSRGRTTFKSPRRASGSPQRRSQVRSARRSPRDMSRSQTRSPNRPRTTTTIRSARSKGDKNKTKEHKKKKSPREDETGEQPAESDGRARQKEFFREELKRLEDSLKRERSKIIRPEVKKHTPYIFNTLEPYYNTYTVRYLLELPDEVQHQFISRRTAIGLTDPWVDHNMDTQFLPRLSGSSRAINRQQELDRRDQKIRERERRSKKEGSTMLPKFPVVTMDSKDLANKKLNYSDVPLLREELRQKYSQNATKKIDEDYKRTKDDFYRMDLDKLDEVHPINRQHMRNTYFAYLQNTPGSKKAINECVKGMKSEGKAH